MKRSLHQPLANRNVHVTISLKTKLLLWKLQVWTLASNTTKRKTLRRADGDMGLLRKKTRFIHFLQQIIRISLYFHVKVFIFVGLCCYRKVFGLYDVQFDGRKLTARHARLNRMLQFTRAVVPPASVATILPEQEYKELHRLHNRRIFGLAVISHGKLLHICGSLFGYFLFQVITGL